MRCSAGSIKTLFHQQILKHDARGRKIAPLPMAIADARNNRADAARNCGCPRRVPDDAALQIFFGGAE
jgi:hypothetical protein